MVRRREGPTPHTRRRRPMSWTGRLALAGLIVAAQAGVVVVLAQSWQRSSAVNPPCSVSCTRDAPPDVKNEQVCEQKSCPVAVAQAVAAPDLRSLPPAPPSTNAVELPSPVPLPQPTAPQPDLARSAEPPAGVIPPVTELPNPQAPVGVPAPLTPPAPTPEPPVAVAEKAKEALPSPPEMPSVPS